MTKQIAEKPREILFMDTFGVDYTWNVPIRHKLTKSPLKHRLSLHTLPEMTRNIEGVSDAA
jgi:hypothetical protein